MLRTSHLDEPLTDDQLADLASVSRRSINSWHNEGLKRKASARDLIAFLMARIAQSSTGSKRQALASEQAEKIRMQNEARRADLAQMNIIEMAVGDLVQAAKKNLLEVPDKLHSESILTADEHENLRSQILQSLEELLAYRPRDTHPRHQHHGRAPA